MEFKTELKFSREETGLSRRQIANQTGLPLGSLENWEWGRSTPPDYVQKMILNKILRLKRRCTVLFGPNSSVTLTLEDRNETRKYNLNMSADGQRLEKDIRFISNDDYLIEYKYKV